MNKLTVTIATLLIATGLYAQKNAEEKAVVNEGKQLYRSEMASWYGTDIFIEKFPEKRESIGGYFSYADGDFTKCVFFSRETTPKVLATISFDSTYNVKLAKVDNADRNLTSLENDIYTIRKTALELINKDSLFKFYKNTSMNLIPIIDGDSKKVFVLTAPRNNGVVIFGNDYLITFDQNNKVSTSKQLHKNIMRIEYGASSDAKGNQIEGGVHTHLPETGNLITSTDICTLMLYQKFAGWKSYIVVSEKYTNIWNCKTNTLIVVPRDVADQKEQNKDGGNGSLNKKPGSH